MLCYFPYVLHAVVSRSSFDHNATRCVLPVWWMMFSNNVANTGTGFGVGAKWRIIHRHSPGGAADGSGAKSAIADCIVMS